MMRYLRPISVFLIPLASFAAVLLILNIFQYYRLKAEASAGVISAISTAEVREFNSFLFNVEEKLLFIRGWEKDDNLLDKDVPALNAKFFPLLEKQDTIRSIVIANDLGQEYSLFKNDDGYRTRLTVPGRKANTLHYQKWAAADTPLDSERVEKSQRDPRNRSWYSNPPDDSAVHWAMTDTVFEAEEQGITASISWKAPGSRAQYTILRMDIPLSRIRQNLALQNSDVPGQLFLTTSNGTHIVGDSGNEQSSPENPDLPRNLISRWLEAGNHKGEPLNLAIGGQQWLAVFQRTGHEQTDIWLGLAVEESELFQKEERRFFTIELFDLAAASAGALLILVFLGRRGLLQLPKRQAAPDIRLRRYIDQGEGSGVEFKSTVRTNLQTGKRGKEIELSWLKAVAAFLNSNGGALLLGVSDSGEICGLGADDFDNNDRCLLHIKNLLNQHIGVDFSGYLEISLPECPEGTVVMVECRPAGEAVFLKIGKSEEFYIRSGPSSSKLSLSQTVAYLERRKYQ